MIQNNLVDPPTYTLFHFFIQSFIVAYIYYFSFTVWRGIDSVHIIDYPPDMRSTAQWFNDCREDARAADLAQFLVPAQPQLPLTWQTNKIQGLFRQYLFQLFLSSFLFFTFLRRYIFLFFSFLSLLFFLLSLLLSPLYTLTLFSSSPYLLFSPLFSSLLAPNLTYFFYVGHLT